MVICFGFAIRCNKFVLLISLTRNRYINHPNNLPFRHKSSGINIEKKNKDYVFWDITCQFILHKHALEVSSYFCISNSDISMCSDRKIGTGKTECLDLDTHIEIPQDRDGLYAIDMLDPDMVSFAPYYLMLVVWQIAFSFSALSVQVPVVLHLCCMLQCNFVVDIKSFSWTILQIIGSDSVYYFHDMIVEFINWGYKEGTTLFGFGYDFRQSNR